MRSANVISGLTAVLMLSGCQQYFARQDTIEPYSGEAVAANRVLMMADPWPPYVYDTRIYTNGRRQADAYGRMSKANEEKKQIETSPVQLVVPQSN
jgi:hypothetical protein